MVNQEKLLKQIKSLSDSIRRKSRALKLGINEREQFLETTFKPIVTPLKQLTKRLDTPADNFEGDNLLPISKYEKSEESEESEDSEELEETEKNEESEESEETRDTLRKNERLDTSEEFEETDNPTPSNLTKLGSDITSKGALGRQYLLKMLHSSQANRKYHAYGARLENDGEGLLIGDSKLDVDADDNVIIGDTKYKGTKGLFELIFKNTPGRYTKRDLILFKKILEKTNAHRKGYSRDSPVHRNRSVKYESIISHLFPSQSLQKTHKKRALSSVEINLLHKTKKRKTSSQTPSGKGLLKSLYETNIIYYNDINKLVDRMKLLYEAMQAGHTGLDNEWIALVDELRNRGVIVY